jgi:hypothetical protein
MADKKYTFWHHRFFLILIRMLVGPFFKRYYRFKAPSIKVKKTGPYLILANHTAEFDIVFLGMLFDAPMYFVASDQLLNSGKGSWVLKTLFSPIPKSKSVADLAVVKRIKSVINEGGNVVIFPEGNSSMNGGPSKIPDGMGRLIKFLKVPVKFIQIKGLYLSSPRWSYFRKFGPTKMQEIKSLSVEESDKLSPEAIDTLVRTTLSISAYEGNQDHFRGKNIAEGLHKLIFTCPQCNGLFTTYSKDDALLCHQCNFRGQYSTLGTLKIIDKSENLIIRDKENLQRFHNIMLRHSSKFHYQAPIEVAFWSGGKTKRSKFEKGKLQISENGLKFTLTSQTIEFSYGDIFASAIQVRTKLLIYPQNGPMLLCRFPRSFSPYAILNIIKWYKTKLLKGAPTDEQFHDRPASTFLGL